VQFGSDGRETEAYSSRKMRGLNDRERSWKPFSASPFAEVAELADALDSGSSARKGVRVQIPASAPYLTWRDRSARLIRQQAVARQLYLQAMRLCAETRCRFATRIISAIPSFA